MSVDLSDSRRYREGWRHKIIVSVDLGKRQDHSALTISEARPERRKNARGGHYEVVAINVRDIQRLPLGMDYEAVARHVYDVFWDERLLLIDTDKNRTVLPQLLVDAGGVGDAVADVLRKTMAVPHVRYRLVSGTAATRKITRLDYTVPRSTMFQMLDAAFNSGRIRIDPRLELAGELAAELKNLKVEMNEETGYVRVVHREGTHDDLAICLASTNWWANYATPKPRVRLLGPEDPTVAKLLGMPAGEPPQRRTASSPNSTSLRMPGSKRWGR